MPGRALFLSAALVLLVGCPGTTPDDNLEPSAEPEPTVSGPGPGSLLPFRPAPDDNLEPSAEPEPTAEPEPNAGPEPEPSAEPEPDPNDPALLCAPTAAPSPIRRLTRTEYNHVLRDLLGIESAPASSFVPDETALGFDNNAAALWVSQILAEQYQEAAEQSAGQTTQQLLALTDCDPAVTSEQTCAGQLIADFGLRAYRRPLSPDEQTRLMTVYDAVRAAPGETYVTALAAVVEALLQSPHFLYRVEHGTGDSDGDGLTKLSDWEMASRLSFLIYNSMPDDELFAAAAAGELSSLAQIEAQARRMLEDDRAQPAFKNFHWQWLHLDPIDYLTKDAAMFPGFNQTVRGLLEQENEAFLRGITQDGTGSLDDLLLSQTTYLNDTLADHYGVDSTGLGAALTEVTLDEHRAGILTQGALLSVLAKTNQTSPILRGVFVRERLLCEPLPSPPDDVDIQPPDPDPNLSTRERFAQHTEDPNCQSCHELIDPVGFGLEDFDAVGRYRTTENGQLVDASGQILYSFEGDGMFNGAVGLAQMLAAEDKVQNCYVSQWFRFGYGRQETADDICALDYLKTTFDESGRNIHELVVALTKTPAFRYRRQEEVTP